LLMRSCENRESPAEASRRPYGPVWGRPSGRDLTDKFSHSGKRKSSFAPGRMLSSAPAFGGISDITPRDACPARDNIPRGAEGGATPQDPRRSGLPVPTADLSCLSIGLIQFALSRDSYKLFSEEAAYLGTSMMIDRAALVFGQIVRAAHHEDILVV